MKTLVSLIILVGSSLAYAGGSGGGGVMMNNFMVRNNQNLMMLGGGGGLRPNSEIVFHIAENNSEVKFAHGVLDGSNWKVEQITLPKEALQLDTEALSAIQKSKQLKQWIKIQ